MLDLKIIKLEKLEQNKDLKLGIFHVTCFSELNIVSLSFFFKCETNSNV